MAPDWPTWPRCPVCDHPHSPHTCPEVEADRLQDEPLRDERDEPVDAR